jgi:hypothetical protein
MAVLIVTVGMETLTISHVERTTSLYTMLRSVTHY